MIFDLKDVIKLYVPKQIKFETKLNLKRKYTSKKSTITFVKLLMLEPLTTCYNTKRIGILL